MVPEDTGFYWVLLSRSSSWQVVWIVGGRISFAGLSEKLTVKEFESQYPEAKFGARLMPPMAA